ncbi:MAG: PLP-dependent transferase [Clostridia bacterium]|nr:PLP-dependent transferase [Clostridia bacterium]
MKTPVCDFVENYIESGKLRLHMPGHKGENFIGCEKYDITEVSGADSLFEANGIIRESELNAGSLFGCHTFYSTEGSSLCIRAMLYLILMYAKEKGINPLILAGRNAHKAFLSGVALLDFEVEWIYSKEGSSYLTCLFTAKELEEKLSMMKEKPAAVYITSPDYSGNMADLKGISEVCRKHNILLAVDNAHGAYLKFLTKSCHPVDFGADICCDSAHKTLPVLTGGAYLHISESAPKFFREQAKGALELFGSTSPSYLILQSLDKANAYLSKEYPKKLADFVKETELLKLKIAEKGYKLLGNEPLKITLDAKAYGYTGTALASELRKRNVECEFCDCDFVVLMLTPENGKNALDSINNALADVTKQKALPPKALSAEKGKRVMSIRQAYLSPKEYLPVEKAQGRILASASISCPPAVPIAVCGELIDEKSIENFRYYGITGCWVVKE